MAPKKRRRSEDEEDDFYNEDYLYEYYNEPNEPTEEYLYDYEHYEDMYKVDYTDSEYWENQLKPKTLETKIDESLQKHKEITKTKNQYKKIKIGLTRRYPHLGPGNDILPYSKNPLDEIARQHDMQYSKAKTPLDIYYADAEMLRKLDMHESEGIYDWFMKQVAKYGITAKYWAERKYGVMYPKFTEEQLEEFENQYPEYKDYRINMTSNVAEDIYNTLTPTSNILNRMAMIRSFNDRNIGKFTDMKKVIAYLKNKFGNQQGINPTGTNQLQDYVGKFYLGSEMTRWADYEEYYTKGGQEKSDEIINDLFYNLVYNNTRDKLIEYSHQSKEGRAKIYHELITDWEQTYTKLRTPYYQKLPINDLQKYITNEPANTKVQLNKAIFRNWAYEMVNKLEVDNRDYEDPWREYYLSVSSTCPINTGVSHL